MRIASGDDKLSLDLVRSVEINCTYAGDSFEGTDLVCWPSRDRVSISSRPCVDFAESAQSRDRVSISPGDILSSLEFGSDLKNLYRGGEL